MTLPNSGLHSEAYRPEEVQLQKTVLTVVLFNYAETKYMTVSP